jgi:hypothetical protein
MMQWNGTLLPSCIDWKLMAAAIQLLVLVLLLAPHQVTPQSR